MMLGFKARFEDPIRRKIKRHTIRALSKRTVRPGDILDCYVNPRQKSMRLLGRWKCIGIQKIVIRETIYRKQLLRWVRLDGEYLNADERELLAISDGFESFEDMMDFWRGHLPFKGLMIHWDPDTEYPPPAERRKARRAAANPQKKRNANG